jgi:hypothetical protein
MWIGHANKKSRHCNPVKFTHTILPPSQSNKIKAQKIQKEKEKEKEKKETKTVAAPEQISISS